MAYINNGSLSSLKLFFFLLLCCSSFHFVSTLRRIKNLPGFDGPLPFALETGYVEVDEEKGVELFYYFIESENKPEEDPLMLWLTGGPGCSALSALIFEMGPLSVDLPGYTGGLPSLFYKPESWTQVSNVIFVDCPVGTGFSYSHTEEGSKSTDIKTVDQLQVFLKKWLEDHPKFRSNPLYIAGDSYAGMIIPILTLNIAIAKESANASFNLKGYLAGNPVTDRNFDVGGSIPFAHGMGLISDELYESTKKSCEGNYFHPSNIQCANCIDAVQKNIQYVNMPHILEPKCEFHSPRRRIDSEDQTPYFDEEMLLLNSDLPLDCRTSGYLLSQFWANNDTVREALRIRKGTVSNWKRCASLNYEFHIPSVLEYHLNVTNKGYHALIYSGDHDRNITFVGTQNWIRSLNFSIVDDWRPWFVGGQVAGFTRKYSNNLTFGTVKGAGHTAPEYKPKECLAMLKRWLSGDLL